MMNKIRSLSNLIFAFFKNIFLNRKKTSFPDNELSGNDVLLWLRYDVLKGVLVWLIVEVFSFTKHIASYFKTLFNKNKYDIKNTKALAIQIKKMLAEGGHSRIDIGLQSRDSIDAILSTTFDIERNEIDIENAQIVEFQSLDEETINCFAGKSLLILK